MSFTNKSEKNKIPSLMFVSVQTRKSAQVQDEDLCNLLTFHNAKNNCDNFTDLMGTRFGLSVGYWQLATHFAGVCGGVIFSRCDSRAQVISPTISDARQWPNLSGKA